LRSRISFNTVGKTTRRVSHTNASAISRELWGPHSMRTRPFHPYSAGHSHFQPFERTPPSFPEKFCILKFLKAPLPSSSPTLSAVRLPARPRLASKRSVRSSRLAYADANKSLHGVFSVRLHRPIGRGMAFPRSLSGGAVLKPEGYGLLKNHQI
jgi:hypothetical protein